MEEMPGYLAEDRGMDDGEQQGGRKKIVSGRCLGTSDLVALSPQPRSLVCLISFVPSLAHAVHLDAPRFCLLRCEYQRQYCSHNSGQSAHKRTSIQCVSYLQSAVSSQQRQTPSSHISHAALNHTHGCTRRACISCKDIVSDAVGGDSLHHAAEQVVCIAQFSHL
jgi:hypothetical protein